MVNMVKTDVAAKPLHDAHDVVCTLGFEKGSVAAIVENNERPYLNPAANKACASVIQ